MAIYSDISSSDGSKILDAASVKQSIENILFTRAGERLFRPDFGASPEEFLFEIDEDDLETMLFHNLTGAFQSDPRIIFEIGETAFERDPQDDNKMYITIVFSVVGLSDSHFEYAAVITR